MPTRSLCHTIGRCALLLSILAAAVASIGASSCPLFAQQDDDDDSDGGGGSTGAVEVDIGGPQGAAWALTYDDAIQVTLRRGGQQGSALIKASSGGLVSVLGNTIDLTSFCWSTDAVCPHQVLTTKTSVVQPAGSPDRFVIGFARRGPLSGVNQVGLIGALDRRDLNVPLGGAAGYKGDPCTLIAGSAVLATAAPAAAAGDAGVDTGVDAGTGDGGAATTERAVTLRGRVNLIFGGTCLSLSTGGSVDPSATVTLSMSFNGVRLD